MWAKIKLGEVCTFQNGRAFKKSEWSETGLPIIRIQNLKKVVTEHNFFDGEYDERIFVRNGDLLLSWSGTIKPFIWCHDDALLNQHVFKVSVSKSLDQAYAYHLLNNILDEISKHKVGIGLQHITKKTFDNFEIILPPLAEQERIVAKLDAAFAEIDGAVELGQERLSRAAKALGQIVDNELSELREEHESCLLGEMLESVEYGTSTKCSKTGKYPVLRMGNMQTGSFVMDDLVYLDSEIELKKYRVRKGDVFFNRTNSALHVGKAAIYDGGSDCLFAGYLIRLNYSDDVLDGRFLNYYLNAPSTRAYGYSVMTSSVNQSNINGTKLKEYPFIKVDLKTQHCIRKKLDDITALLYKVHFLLGKSLSEYAQLKSAILKQELQPSEAA